jgi:transcriptional regulator with XRE-family HTH domain
MCRRWFDMSNSIPLKTFAKRLKQLREDHYLTQDELAVEVNLKKSTLSKYENELSEPRLGNVKKIADYFEVSSNWLTGYSDIRDKNAVEEVIPMKFYERFNKLLKDNDISIGKISKEIGVPYTTLDAISKRQLTNIKLENVFKIAKYFGVTVEYLATGSEEPILESIKLNEEERDLITLWRKMPRDERMKIVGRVEVIVEQFLGG